MARDANTTTGDREQSRPTTREGTKQGQPGQAGQQTRTPATQRNRSIQYQNTGQAQSLLRRAADDMEQLMQLVGFGGFDNFGLRPFAPEGLRTVWAPSIDVSSKNGNLVVRADLPGVQPDDVNVEIDDGVLRISGERSDTTEEDRDGFYRSERLYGQFYRAIPLPDGADEDRIEARFDNGVLEIKVPTPEQQTRQARRVQVTSGNGGDRKR